MVVGVCKGMQRDNLTLITVAQNTTFRLLIYIATEGQDYKVRWATDKMKQSSAADVRWLTTTVLCNPEDRRILAGPEWLFSSNQMMKKKYDVEETKVNGRRT